MQPLVGTKVLYNHPEQGMVCAFIVKEYPRVLVPDRGEYGSYDYWADLFLMMPQPSLQILTVTVAQFGTFLSNVPKSFENTFDVGKWNYDTHAVRKAVERPS